MLMLGPPVLAQLTNIQKHQNKVSSMIQGQENWRD